MNLVKVNKIFKIFWEQSNFPQTELTYSNHYTLLIAIVLSAQATDISVNKATDKLFAIVRTPEEMVDLGEEALRGHIKTIGLFNIKAKNIIKLSKILIEKYNSAIPRTLEELDGLPGVGRKTANVMLNCAFGEPTIAVDTHVFRVSNRIGLIKANNVLAAERSLQKRIPKEWKLHAHHWLILHGRYICQARSPKCVECRISSLCEFKAKTKSHL